MTIEYPTADLPDGTPVTLLPAVLGTEAMVLDLVEQVRSPNPAGSADRGSPTGRRLAGLVAVVDHAVVKTWLAYSDGRCVGLTAMTLIEGRNTWATINLMAPGVGADEALARILTDLATTLAGRAGRQLAAVETRTDLDGVTAVITAMQDATGRLDVGPTSGWNPVGSVSTCGAEIAWHDDDATFRPAWARAA